MQNVLDKPDPLPVTFNITGLFASLLVYFILVWISIKHTTCPDIKLTAQKYNTVYNPFYLLVLASQAEPALDRLGLPSLSMIYFPASATLSKSTPDS